MRCNLLVLCLLGFTGTTVLAQENINAELLASSCAACHGTNGHSLGGLPSLAGVDKLYLIEQMQQFVSGERASTVMKHHASGYTAEEIELMADFFSKQ
jgi:sulfide dehydrogenase cytochrome subunit